MGVKNNEHIEQDSNTIILKLMYDAIEPNFDQIYNNDLAIQNSLKTNSLVPKFIAMGYHERNANILTLSFMLYIYCVVLYPDNLENSENLEE